MFDHVQTDQLTNQPRKRVKLCLRMVERKLPPDPIESRPRHVPALKIGGDDHLARHDGTHEPEHATEDRDDAYGMSQGGIPVEFGGTYVY